MSVIDLAPREVRLTDTSINEGNCDVIEGSLATNQKTGPSSLLPRQFQPRDSKHGIMSKLSNIAHFHSESVFPTSQDQSQYLTSGQVKAGQVQGHAKSRLAIRT